MPIKTTVDCAARRPTLRSCGLSLGLRHRSVLCVVSVLALVLPVGALGTSRRRAAAQDHSSATGTNATERLSARASSRTARRHRKPRVSDYRRRIAKIHLEPDRVKAIQGALAQAGYLHQEPNGEWDVE